jgi:hypothetical protein
MENKFDDSGLKVPESLEELEKEFENAGPFIRRKNCNPQRPSILLKGMSIVKLCRQLMEKEIAQRTSGS